MPWRETKNPYHIVVSEIMLQQTQVERVMKKYPLFIKKFPSFQVLAWASRARVLAVWQGLGYNRRALALQKIAHIVVNEYKGALPSDHELLQKMPGIGKATAGSVATFAFNRPIPFIETNIRRVYIHFFFAKKRKVNDAEILPLVLRTMDLKNPREWFFALMDYGSMLGEKMKTNPNKKSAHYMRQPKFEGSRRQLRGNILKTLLTRRMGLEDLAKQLSRPTTKIAKILYTLERDGLIQRKENIFSV